MIKFLTNNNLDLLNNSFIDKQYIISELKVNPYARILVYIENNIIIGYLYYSEIYERVEINQIEVENIHRNCGIGTLLLKKLTETVEKNITLEVRCNNYSALKLYNKFNFKKVAIRKGYYQGIDGILMERKFSSKESDFNG